MNVKLKKAYSIYLDVLDSMTIGIIAVITIKAIYRYNNTLSTPVHTERVTLQGENDGILRVLVELSNGTTSVWNFNDVVVNSQNGSKK